MKLAQQNLFRFLGWNTQGDLGPWTFYTNKRRALVWFLKAPPKNPPTWKQRLQRARFTFAAILWQSLQPDQRAAWGTAARRAHLRITPYNFFCYVQLRRDFAAARTVAHQSGVDLQA